MDRLPAHRWRWFSPCERLTVEAGVGLEQTLAALQGSCETDETRPEAGSARSGCLRALADGLGWKEI